MTKQELIDRMSKHFKSGYYWLVRLGDDWKYCLAEPKFQSDEMELWYVEPAYINQVAVVEHVK